ncbi:hypothetical protein [Frigidibacter sp.]|uniref:hypothetical protein n=1 Tax=Frigidibacter sp. TaxID=2586418 RepID=UPI002736B274|nr:hypothetical protein [Frigidibacter sp.]MDP3340218.1 hypothetical protein [Frigidibacter sp.]
MAYTANHDAAFTTATGGRFSAFLARLGASFERYAERHSRADEIARFDAMSDAELAKIGVTRDGIVQHVFRDKLYI